MLPRLTREAARRFGDATAYVTEQSRPISFADLDRDGAGKESGIRFQAVRAGLITPQEMARVAQRGWDDDTDVFFTTDHGELQGDFGLLFKGPYHVDGLMRLPLVWRPAPSSTVAPAWKSSSARLCSGTYCGWSMIRRYMARVSGSARSTPAEQRLVGELREGQERLAARAQVARQQQREAAPVDRRDVGQVGVEGEVEVDRGPWRPVL